MRLGLRAGAAVMATMLSVVSAQAGVAPPRLVQVQAIGRGAAAPFVSGVGDPRTRELLTRSVLEAIRACTPLRMSPGLSRAVAGRPVSIRFIYVGRKGQGV